jgi:hypothetical protein
MEAELPFARAKLERLIQGRATVLAQELHEKWMRLELEAVKAEMAGRMRAFAQLPSKRAGSRADGSDGRRRGRGRGTGRPWEAKIISVGRASLAELQASPSPHRLTPPYRGHRRSLTAPLEQNPRGSLNRTATSYELARLRKVDPGAR